MNSKSIKFDKAPSICDSNHQTAPTNMIPPSNKVSPIYLPFVLKETAFLDLW